MIKLTLKDDAVIFEVRVQPRASRSGVAGELDGALKVRLAAPPIEGQANEELICLLGKLLDVPRRQIEIISGQASRNKVVRVRGISADACEKVWKSLGKSGKV